MNFIDIIILVPLAYAAYKGFKKGFIIEIFTLLALLVGIYAGIHFSDWTAAKLTDNFTVNQKYVPVISFTVTFLAIGAMVYFAGKMLEKMVSVVNLSMLNKLLGILFSVIKMLYFISIIFIILESYDEKGQFLPQELKEESTLYYPVEKISTATIPGVEKSKIWLKNHFVQDSIENNLTFDDIIRYKRMADSLGIDADDIMEAKNKIDQLEND